MSPELRGNTWLQRQGQNGSRDSWFVNQLNYQLSSVSSRCRTPGSVLRRQHEARPGVVAVVVLCAVTKHALGNNHFAHGLEGLLQCESELARTRLCLLQRERDRPVEQQLRTPDIGRELVVAAGVSAGADTRSDAGNVDFVIGRVLFSAPSIRRWLTKTDEVRLPGRPRAARQATACGDRAVVPAARWVGTVFGLTTRGTHGRCGVQRQQCRSRRVRRRSLFA